MHGAPQPIVADFVEPLRQHMLQKAPDELVGRQGHGLPALILGILIAEAHVAVLDRENTAIGQRNPVDISPQVLQDWLGTLHGGFAVDDPPFGPDRFRNDQIWPFLVYELPKQAAKELGEGLDGYQVGGAGWPPCRVISGDPTGRDQAVHVRMVGQSVGPGVQHTEDPDHAPHIMGVRGERDERVCRGSESDVVQIFLVGAYKRP
jgi:hypothetical protein